MGWIIFWGAWVLCAVVGALFYFGRHNGHDD